MLPTLVVGRRVHRPNPDPIRRPVTGGAGRGGRRASGPAGGPAPGDGARRDRIGDGGGVRRVRGAAGPDEDGAGPCGNGADDDLVIRTGSGVSPGETEPFSPGTAIPGPGSARWRGRAGAGWCGWGSWGGPGRGRVQICHKGAPGRDRSGEEARNINDSPPVLRRDPGLCGRFGQTTPPRAPGGSLRIGRRPRRAPRSAGRARGGIRRGRRGPRRRPPGRSSTPRGALRIRKCSSSRRFRVQNAHLECRMHFSARKRAGHGRHRPRRRSRPGAFPVTRRERVTEPFSPGRPPDWPGSA